MTTQHSKPLLIVQLASLVEIISDILFDPKKKKKNKLGHRGEFQLCKVTRSHRAFHYGPNEARRDRSPRLDWWA